MGRRECSPGTTFGRIPARIWKLRSAPQAAATDRASHPGSSHALLLSSSPSRGARPAPCRRRTVPRRLALVQATGSPLQGRAPSVDAPGGLLGIFLFSRDPPLAGELRGCAGSPLQPQVPGAQHAALPGCSGSRVLLGRCLPSPLLLACGVWSAPAPRMEASS